MDLHPSTRTRTDADTAPSGAPRSRRLARLLGGSLAAAGMTAGLMGLAAPASADVLRDPSGRPLSMGPPGRLPPGPQPPRHRTQASASSRARDRTASSIGSVSLPVKVFCWLTW
jgi:hypothetical protein